jgi:hypothetical protein
LLDRIIRIMGYPEYEASWQTQKDIDPLVQAQIDDIYLKGYVIAPEEVRKRIGMEGPAPEKPEPPPVVNMPPNGDNGDNNNSKKPPAKIDDKVEKIERSKKKALNQLTGKGILY